MDLFSLGWENYSKKLERSSAIPETGLVGRVAAENRKNWIVFSELGENSGIVLKNFSRKNPMPKIGDWILFKRLPGEEKVLIEKVLPRFSKISRKDPRPGGKIEEQTIAVNIDKAFLVQGLDNNFNFNRLERYLTMVRDGNVEPVIVFNKTDVADNLDSLMGLVQDRFKNTKTFFVSAETGEGIKNIKDAIRVGETVVFLGSSGVGKSTIINSLFETTLQATGEVREKDSKGRHTTSRREMFILPVISAESRSERGGIVIDTPGMRELQVLVSQESVDDIFEDFEKLGKGCRFADCDHETSKDCAILAKVKTGEIVSERYKSFLKLRREAGFISSKSDPEQERAKKSFWKKVNKSLKTRGKLEE